MEKIFDFESVISALKNYQILRIEIPIKSILFLRDSRIYVKTDHAQFSLELEEFRDLYINSVFYIHEKKKDVEIENMKDDEYYAWKHK